MLLGVELDADLADELELGLEEVDVAFLVGGELLEQGLGDAVVDAVAVLRRLEVEGAGVDLGGEVGLQDSSMDWPMRSGSSTCMLGKPSRKRMRSTKRSAWRISSIDSSRHFLARSLKPQSSRMR